MGVKHTVSYMIARFVPAAVTMFTVYFYTNNVEPTQYGLFSKISAISGIVYPLFFAPIWYYILRYTLQDGSIILKRAYTTFWAVSILIVTFALCACMIMQSRLFDEVFAIVLMIVLYGNIQIRLEQLRAGSQPNRYLLLAAARSFAVLAAAFLFVKYDLYFLVSPLVDSTLCAILLCVLPFDIKSLKLVQIGSSLQNMKIVYKFGLFLAIYSVFNTALFSLDRVLIGYINSDYAAGLYASSYDLATKIVHTFVFALELSMLPMLLKVKSENGNLSDQFSKNTKTYLFIMIPLVVGLLSIAPSLITLYFPSEYREAARTVFPIIVLSTFVGGFSNAIFHHSYLLRDNTRKLFKSIGIVLIFNVLLNSVVDVMGAPLLSAYVSLIAFSIYAIITYRHTKEFCGFNFPVKFAIILLLMSLPMMVYASLIGYSSNLRVLAIEVGASAIVYGFSCYLINVNGIRGLVNARISSKF